ncbi:hypothetical protein C8J57DRAFT_1252652 [Mycena rebaudengoi]|nr:hypothetical protein C8J57DRAFT_1252652 [Mycena rebaudengoi]
MIDDPRSLEEIYIRSPIIVHEDIGNPTQQHTCQKSENPTHLRNPAHRSANPTHFAAWDTVFSKTDTFFNNFRTPDTPTRLSWLGIGWDGSINEEIWITSWTPPSAKGISLRYHRAPGRNGKSHPLITFRSNHTPYSPKHKPNPRSVRHTDGQIYTSFEFLARFPEEYLPLYGDTEPV